MTKYLEASVLSQEIEYFISTNDAEQNEAVFDMLPTETLKEINLQVQAILVHRYSNRWRKDAK